MFQLLACSDKKTVISKVNLQLLSQFLNTFLGKQYFNIYSTAQK